MRKTNRKIEIICLLLLTFVFEISSQCLPEDCAEKTEVETGLIEIAAPTISLITVDFEAMSTGPTTVAAINAAYPGIALSSITSDNRIVDGVYNYFTAGNAFGVDNMGNFAIIPVGDLYTSANNITFSLSVTSTEVGVEISDWEGPITITFLMNGVEVASDIFNTNNSMQFFQSAAEFNGFRLTALPSFGANWVVGGLALPDGAAAVPTLSQWGLIILALFVFIFGILLLRQRKVALG